MGFNSWKLEGKGTPVAFRHLICLPVQPFIVTFFLLFLSVQVMGFLVFLKGDYSACSYNSSKNIFNKNTFFFVLISIQYLYFLLCLLWFHFCITTWLLTSPTVFSLCLVTDHCFLHHVGSYNSSLAPQSAYLYSIKCTETEHRTGAAVNRFYCGEQLLTLSSGMVHYSVNLFPSLLLIMHVMFTVHCEIHVYYKNQIILK